MRAVLGDPLFYPVFWLSIALIAWWRVRRIEGLLTSICTSLIIFLEHKE